MKRFSVISLIVSLLFILSCEDKVEKDTTPPSLTIISPSNGETISDKVVIKVTTEDDKEISKVEFYIDDSLHVTDGNSPYEYEWDTFPYKNGEHSIKISSYDLSENFSEQSISVILYNMKIVFVSYEQKNFFISIIDIHGKNYERLTYGIHPQFSPDGSKIMYLSGRGFDNLEIFSMDTNGDNQTRLTNNDDGDNEFSHQFSPDGSQIVFISQRDSDGDGNNVKIYIMDSDGSNQTKLWDYESDHPQFSPDGSRIVFYTNKDGNSEIYTMDTDGNNQTRLTNNSSVDYYPQFSPDGSKIVFVRDVDIYTMDTDGNNQTRLTNNSSIYDYPQFSPDGSKMVYVGYNSGIYIMDVDGNNQTELYQSGNNPQFSPDGSKIVFVSRLIGFSGLYIMNVDGTNLTRLHNNGQNPQFQPPPKSN
jgi:Tol biopolymer transport system component